MCQNFIIIQPIWKYEWYINHKVFVLDFLSVRIPVCILQHTSIHRGSHLKVFNSHLWMDENYLLDSPVAQFRAEKQRKQNPHPLQETGLLQLG